MIESEDIIDPVLQIPVFSLYGQTRIPEARMFEPIDVLLVDLQDVGTRVYTFIYTLSYCLKRPQHKIRVVILDRPNPINGIDIEGIRWLLIVGHLSDGIRSPCARIDHRRNWGIVQ